MKRFHDRFFRLWHPRDARAIRRRLAGLRP